MPPRRPTLSDAFAAADVAALTNESFLPSVPPADGANERRGVLVRVTPEVRCQLKIAAARRGTTVQNLLLKAIASILDEPPPTPAP